MIKPRRSRIVRRALTIFALAALAGTVPAAGQSGAEAPPAGRGATAVPGSRPPAADRGCVLCHGELELLRQRVPTLGDARALLVPPAAPGTAHDTMRCGSCHGGFDQFPHVASRGTTRTCASCHEEEETRWSAGVHAREAPGEADCAACHGVHDVLPPPEPTDSAARAGGPWLDRMNGTCLGCHETSAMPASDPHAYSVGCASCHRAHDTDAVEGPLSAVASAAQGATCGTCHQDVAAAAAGDAHGLALAGLAPGGAGPEGDAEPPGCTGCHGAHGMLAPSAARFDQDMVGRCAACHADAADTYYGTYHGKATAVGSEIAATCDHCHGSHEIFAADHAGSAVAPDRLEETCGACHEHVRPAFVLYDSHPDPMDRERNPALHYSFVFMNTLLFGVLGVFALHTALWWVRIMIDRSRGDAHGGGGTGGAHV